MTNENGTCNTDVGDTSTISTKSKIYKNSVKGRNIAAGISPNSSFACDDDTIPFVEDN